MLIVVPLSIYLAAARVFVLALFRNPLVGVGTWIMFGVFAIVVMLVTTVILLLMAEAVLWYLVRVQRMCRKNEGTTGPAISDRWSGNSGLIPSSSGFMSSTKSVLSFSCCS